jgi:Flp pilus assembly pilin Flp
MSKIVLGLHSLLWDRRGVTAIEYAVLAGAVAVAVVGIMGTSSTAVMGALSAKLTAIINGIPTIGN